jgi:hypothetical protein
MTGGDDAGVGDQKDFFDADLAGQFARPFGHVVPEDDARAGLVIEGGEDGAVREPIQEFGGPAVHAAMSRERRL